jgi:Ca-activated chloride channel family protein
MTRTAFAFIVAIAAAALSAQEARVSLTITFPPEDSYISGPVVLRARIDPPSAAVTRMSFFADGRLICNVDRPPFECAWDAGAGVDKHQIRVQAVLASGQRLVQSVRTKGVAYAEAVEVDAIQVTVAVTDDHGNFVRRLPREAFRVFEDDVPQKITHFASHDISLELTAAIDVSGSMTDAMPQLKQTVKRFLSSLRPEDKVSLLAFNDNIFTLARASVEPAARIRVVDRLAAWGGTSLYDVIVRSVDMLGRQLGRRALIVFSDGEDTASHITLATAEKRLQMSDATVYTIAQGRATKAKQLRDVLERIARTSGGRAFAFEDIDQLGHAFDEILEDLSNQYLLVYTPPIARRDGAWHRIRVQVSPGQHKVRTREGYLAPAPGRK